MIPENEQGVIVLFAQQAEAAGFEILRIGMAFPDATICKNGITYQVEFEYQSSNFLTHGHDPRKCDLIICWQNDFPSSILPILSLSNSEWKTMDIELPSPDERCVEYWKRRAQRAEAEAKRFKNIINAQYKKERMNEALHCPGCDEVFGSQQAINAHQRFCAGGTNGKEPAPEPETEQAQ